MPRRSIRSILPLAVLLALIGSLITAAPAAASPGDLDTSFGTGGKVTTPIGTGNDQAWAVAIQSDGKIVAAGGSFTSLMNYDIAVVRYTTAGAPDTTFGTDGKVTTPIGNSNDEARAVAIQADGKIVAAGYTAAQGSPSDFGLVRLTTSGALDTTFGSGGKVLTSMGVTDQVNALAIQSDGKIVAAGNTSVNSASSDFALARYTTTGALDTTFGTGGKVITTIGTVNIALAVAIQADGKVVAAGFSNNGSDHDFTLARYTTTGALDTTFGNGGIVVTPMGSFNDVAQAVAIQSNGKIVAVGTSNDEFALARYTTTGALDTTFGNGGIVLTPIGSFGGPALDVAIQSNGKIVAAGYSATSGNNRDFATARYLPTGELDPSFGTGGKVVTDLSPNDFGYAVALQSDGKIVVAGWVETNSNNDFALLRYLGDPAPATVPVSIVSSPSPGAFSPSTAVGKPGDSVRWANSTFTTHTTTGDAPLSYWDSGNLTFGQTFTQAFPVAGAYGYHCSIHPSMVGTVMVNPRAAPPSGSTASTFLITWASGSIPSGFRADVIIKRPGAGWAAWMTNRSGTQTYATFTPDAGAGTYLFAARFRKVATGSPATGWAGVGITVS